jgi:hypothetical protein
MKSIYLDVDKLVLINIAVIKLCSKNVKINLFTNIAYRPNAGLLITMNHALFTCNQCFTFKTLAPLFRMT